MIHFLGVGWGEEWHFKLIKFLGCGVEKCGGERRFPTHSTENVLSSKSGLAVVSNYTFLGGGGGGWGDEWHFQHAAQE